MSDDGPLYARVETFSVKCPFCGRFERLGSQPAGFAWLAGHIYAEHPDALPPFEGAGGT